MIKVILSDTVRLRLAWARKSNLKNKLTNKQRTEKENGGSWGVVEMTKAPVIFFCLLCFCRHFAGEETVAFTLLAWDLFPLLQTLS